MRLINTATLALHDFPISEPPRYGILSHTWEDGEVGFNEWSSPSRSLKKGYEKIRQTCRLAREDGLGFVWVDTCCIDKSSSSELSESINSMFQWYANATVCYVFLADLPSSDPIKSGLPRCRWLTRGWTLQELLAPKVLKFYDMVWGFRGTKRDLPGVLSTSTGIPRNILLGRSPLLGSSIAARMSWAANRQTSRVEDTAYCLLGILDVNIPLIYGEGDKAFRRLQEEVIKQNNDLTIFAWEPPPDDTQAHLSLLASSPAAFANSRFIGPFLDDFANFSVTNKGLLLTGDIPLRAAVINMPNAESQTLYLLNLGGIQGVEAPADTDKVGGIYLRKVGPKLLCRVGQTQLAGFGRNKITETWGYVISEIYIAINSYRQSITGFRYGALHVPRDHVFELEEAIPGSLWDHTDRIFLKPTAYTSGPYSVVIGMIFNGTVAGIPLRLVVLYEHRKGPPVFKVFREDQYPREKAFIFQEKHRENTMSWEDLDLQLPHITALENQITIVAEGEESRVSVSTDEATVDSVLTSDPRGLRVRSLAFTIN